MHRFPYLAVLGLALASFTLVGCDSGETQIEEEGIYGPWISSFQYYMVVTPPELRQYYRARATDCWDGPSVVPSTSMEGVYANPDNPDGFIALSLVGDQLTYPLRPGPGSLVFDRTDLQESDLDVCPAP